jgi:hypothetical protein
VEPGALPTSKEKCKPERLMESRDPFKDIKESEGFPTNALTFILNPRSGRQKQCRHF